MSGFQTPALQSGFSSPFYAQSRAGSSENLAGLAMSNSHSHGVAPAALSQRLHNVSLDPSQRNTSFNSLNAITEDVAFPTSNPTGQSSQSHSAALTRQNSNDEHSNSHSSGPSGRNSPEHLDFPDMATLSKVPSYTTAIKTPARRGTTDALPDYFSAMSAPNTPPASEAPVADPLSMIPEHEGGTGSEPTTPGGSHRSWHRPASMTSLLHAVQGGDDRRLHLLQGRERVY